MIISFSKYHGAGNDFILIDNRRHIFSKDDKEFIKSLCAPHTGVGADGLILLESHSDLDYRMIYFNSDGKEASFCGNGSRCLLAFAIDLGIVEKKACFEAYDGLHEAKQVSKDLYSVSINPIQSMIRHRDHWQLDTGSPHYVIFSKHIQEKDLIKIARKIRYSPAFSEQGINVDLLEEKSIGKISIRTYERGLENETLACGTGVVAAAIAYAGKNKLSANIQIDVQTTIADFQVSFTISEEGHFKNIFLIGPAQKVYRGSFEYED